MVEIFYYLLLVLSAIMMSIGIISIVLSYFGINHPSSKRHITLQALSTTLLSAGGTLLFLEFFNVTLAPDMTWETIEILTRPDVSFVIWAVFFLLHRAALKMKSRGCKYD